MRPFSKCGRVELENPRRQRKTNIELLPLKKKVSYNRLLQVYFVENAVIHVVWGHNWLLIIVEFFCKKGILEPSLTLSL